MGATTNLGDVVVHAGAETLGVSAFHGVGGDGHDGQTVVAAPSHVRLSADAAVLHLPVADVTGCFPTIHLQRREYIRHRHVKNN